MSELISGKDAYNLIGQGVEVQAHVEYEKGLFEWRDAKELPACDILDGCFEFRLKPKTFMLNGIEVPKPNKPESCYSSNGSVIIVMDDNDKAVELCMAIRKILTD